MIGIKLLEDASSKLNGKISVYSSWAFGKYLQVGGLTQSGGVVSSIWKQTLSKLPKQNFSNILVLGVAGGSVIHLLRKKFKDAKITGIEIDPVMIEVSRKYFDLDGTNAQIIIGDAKDFKGKNYDLILVDTYTGDNYPVDIENEVFLKKVKSSLSSSGLVVFNRLYFSEKRKGSVLFGKKLEKIFKFVDWYYPEANLMFFCRP